MEPQEIEDEEHEHVLERVAAVDVAKASGMVCTRVPDPARPGRRRTRGVAGGCDHERGPGAG
jgi:transposase